MDGQIDVVATCGQKIKLMTLQRSQTQKCLLLTFFSLLPPKSIYDKRILVLLLCTTTHLSDWSWHMLQYRQCTVLVLVNFQSGFCKKNEFGHTYQVSKYCVTNYKVMLNIINNKHLAFNLLENWTEIKKTNIVQWRWRQCYFIMEHVFLP